MISRFKKVVDGLFRGSAPNDKDVFMLKNKYNIKKIISLDENAGKKIDDICKKLHIEHITIPINGKDIHHIIELFSNDLDELLIENGPTFVHCAAGKDRTGMLIASYKVSKLGVPYEEAMSEARQLGFGFGLNPVITRFYENVVKYFANEPADVKSDILSNQHANPLILDDVNVKSFAPYLDMVRYYPADIDYSSDDEQYPTRDNVNNKEYIDKGQKNKIPLVGIYDNNSGIKGVGPVDNGGGFTAT